MRRVRAPRKSVTSTPAAGAPGALRRRLAGLALVVAALLAACGNGNETPGAGGAAGLAGASSAGGGVGGSTASTAGTASNTGGASGSGGFAPGGAASGGNAAGGTSSGGAAGGNAAGGNAAGGNAAGGMGGVGGVGGGSGGQATGGSSVGGSSGGSSGVVRSAGCGQVSKLTFEPVPGESGSTVGFGTGGYVRVGNRGFAVRLPDNYDPNKPYWLIFGFHWNGGNSKEVDTGGSNGYNMSHFGLQKASKNGAIFVAPDGLNAGWANSQGQDLKLVDDIVTLIEDNYCVDKSRLYANGFSYGGGMSYAIACARAKVFRGVAIYNGAVLSGCEGGNDPIAYWQMGGLTDNTCTIGAGRSMRDKFVKANGCTAQSPPEPPQPPPYLSQGGHVCTTYTGCSSGHPLRWCAHQSGHGNAVVDGTADLYNTCATAPKTCSSTCPCTWVPDDVWAFFNSL